MGIKFMSFPTYLCAYIEISDFSDDVTILLNQAHAGLWPVHAWFLEIVSVRTSVCVFACLCVSAPEAINN